MSKKKKFLIGFAVFCVLVAIIPESDKGKEDRLQRNVARKERSENTLKEQEAYEIATEGKKQAGLSEKYKQAVNVGVILQDFKNNEIGANSRYKNREVAFYGTISSFDSSIMGNPIVNFNEGDYGFDGVSVEFDSDFNEVIGRLAKGDNIGMIGELSSYTLGSVMLDGVAIRETKKGKTVFNTGKNESILYKVFK